MVTNLHDAHNMFEALKSPCGLRRALKRALVNRDSFYLRAWWQAVSPAVIAQAFIDGRPANCAVACWEGRVLAQIDVEVLATSRSSGPASVVRRVDNPEMRRAAERIARRLNLSGLLGLDFMIETGSGAVHLIEMNPRCTPLCHIQPSSGPSLIEVLHAKLAGRALSASGAVISNGNEVIAYYPAWTSNKELLESSIQDFPQGEPELAQTLLRPFPEGTLLYRIADYFSSPSMAESYEPLTDVTPNMLSSAPPSFAEAGDKLRRAA
jgi:hypothetical protein